MMQRAIVVAGLTLAFATPAMAAEGGLQIAPDLLEVFQGTKSPLESHTVQLLLLFVLLVVPVNQFVLKPLLRVLDERSASIEGARKRAAEVGKRADAALERYRAAVEVARKQAGEVRREALETARGDQVRILGEARGAAEAQVATARTGVADALGEARTTLRVESTALAREAAARVLGRPLS
jgi:F-type H+-transporting ATPase subunit b